MTVVIINGVYLMLLIFLFMKKKGMLPKEVTEEEILPYHNFSIISVIFFVSFSMFRNSDIFNYNLLQFELSTGLMFTIAFLVQFVLQFLIILFYVIPTRKIFRIIHAWSIMFMMATAIWTCLFKFKPINENKIEMAIEEIGVISDELSKFRMDVSTKISNVNESIESILIDIQKKEKDLKDLNNSLKQKEVELKEINSAIAVDRVKIKDLMELIEKEETLLDKILNNLGVFFMGVASSYFTLYLPLIRRIKNNQH